ncbi:DNA repair protein RecN (Recombination protein N) [Agromyces flavus]|uniref:DNA repair protein RecN n=1 Tax=Agromyces flavus TaxID=589382 RepID=A0A1H1SS35_9MICO|nr:DNA repair protein RecN [Agromyces flavus]MCP2369319.1 DNA repair protein RecN (Recombination protein N) [Agromyces flavus]GGI48532.1 DNA repair protein RecN [Agromyces flavus]SDS50810.1 DNA replication and repair protein RecN [Agromyces flavus]
MIEELGIRDLGVIAEANLPLGPGFTAVTGETGAGKTMVVTALGLLLGARADAGTVRSGAKQAWVEGRWLLDDVEPVADRVADAGGEIDGGELLLGRSVSTEGRSRAIVGGRSAPVGVLAELADHLVVVHGQADQQRLRSAAAQREALDRFGGAELAAALGEYRIAYRAWRAEADELRRLREHHDERAREADELRLALDEVEAADPQPGEDAALQERAERLTNLEDLRLAAAQARELISAETAADDVPDAITLVEAARRHVDRVVAHDPALAPIAESVAGAGFALADAAAELSSYLAGLDADGAAELEGVQERLAVIGQLIRRHGSLDDALAFRHDGGLRLVELDGDDDRIVELEASVEQHGADVAEIADRLSDLRAGAAERLAREVTAELSALAMPDAELTILVERAAEPGSHGQDHVAILLRPHPGAEPRPVSKGASGGELSRVMLAIEVVIAGADPVPTFVFDEVDAGVGGAAAIEIGRRLARLAERSQVIVVTHLAQVAAFASNHLSVVKGTDGRVTASSVRQLTGTDREAEMARLLSGLADSESGLAHARELLEIADSAAA